MENLKEIAAYVMLFSIVMVVVIALFLGMKAIWNHIVGYGTYKLRQRENQEEIAAYRAKVKELEMKSKATEVVAS